MNSDSNIDNISYSRYVLWYNIFIYAYTALLFALNFSRIFDNNFWGDECYSIKLAHMSIANMIVETAQDVHPPLYYIILMFLLRMFGSHGWLFHVVSILPYAIELIIALTYIRRKFQDPVPIVFITFISLMNCAFVYNVEVRMYSWASLFVLLSFLSCLEILEANSKRSYFFFIFFSLAAAYTHYYALISVALFYLFLLLYAFIRSKHIKEILITCGITMLGYSYWFIVLLKTVKRTSEDFWLTGIPGVKDCLNFVFNPSEKTWVMIVVVTMFLATLLISIRKSERDDPFRLWEICGLMSVFVTMALGEIVSHIVRPIFQTKYLFPATATIWLIFAVNIGRMKHKNIVSMILIAVILLTGIPCDMELAEKERDYNDMLMETTSVITRQITNDDIIRLFVHTYG